ncbi:hypothetical protein OAS86_05150, partial [Gammaproteobacteria bacterium]|nr:hypothetical protein [Gammaproteobacteria bacterium]
MIRRIKTAGVIAPATSPRRAACFNAPTIGRWLLTLIGILLLKAFYRQANHADLAWMLEPLAMLLQWSGEGTYARLADGSLYFAHSHFVLVRACAGVNFMVIVLLILGWQPP